MMRGEAFPARLCRGPALTLVALVLVAGGQGCQREASKGAPAPTAVPVAPAAAGDPELADLGFDPQRPIDPARVPVATGERPLEVAARYILVTHAGAERAVSSRSPAAAAKRATVLAQQARQRGADFVALARRFSEAPVAARGAVEVFGEGEAESPFTARALALGEGQVGDPVQTKYGYYVIERVPLEAYSTAHVLVSYAGAKLAPPALARTREEARAQAEKVAQLAAAPAANFALLASRFSDSPSKVRGGVIAPVRPERLLEGFEPYLAAARGLAEGQVSGVVETPYGFHVIKRLALRKVLVRHILIGCKECDAKPRTPRLKREAYALALQLLRQLREPGADFSALARQHSDDPSAERGGELPPFARGEMEPRFEQYAFGLRVGQIADLVETRFGYHLIQRLR